MTIPQPGQLWSLRSANLDLPAPVVLLLDHRPDGGWQAQWAFDAAALACDTDVQVLDGRHPQAANGDGWWAALAPSDTKVIPPERLWQPLFSLDAATLAQVRAAYRGEPCSLRRGLQLLPDLDDPRIPVRAQELLLDKMPSPLATVKPVADVKPHGRRKWFGRKAIRNAPRRRPDFVMWGGLLAACLVIVIMVWQGRDTARPVQPAPPIAVTPSPEAALPAIVAVLDGSPAGLTITRGNTVFPATARLDLREGDRLRATDAANAVIAYRDGSRFTLPGACELSLHTENGAKRLDLVAGTIKGQVVPQPAGEPMRMVTPHAQASVLGTEFSLAVSIQATRLEVTHGRMGLMRLADRATIEVTDGQFAVVAAGVELVAQAIAGPQPKPGPDQPAGQPAPAGPTGSVFLSDLAELEVRVGFGEFGKNGDLGYPPGRIHRLGQEVPHGLSLHPPKAGSSHVAYVLGKKYATFQTGVTIDDKSFGLGSPLVFKVLGDGRLLWQSQPFEMSFTPQECRLDVANVEKLELEVESAGNNEGSCAIWLEPQVLAK